MTQKELAQALGISRATVSKYEAGLRTPNMDMIMKLSDVLGCTTDYLLGRTMYDGLSAGTLKVSVSEADNTGRYLSRGVFCSRSE